MDEQKIMKIDRFLKDRVTSETVYGILLDSFLKERPGADVYVLAASRLAVDFLKQGWRDLEKFKNSASDIPMPTGNIGV